MQHETPTITQDQIEQSIRDVAAKAPDSVMGKLVAHVDQLRAEGQSVEFRLDATTKRVTAVVLEKVAVDLAEFAEDEGGEMPVGEDGRPLIDFAWADDDAEQAAA